MITRKKIAMLMAEFVGVAALATIALAVTQSNVGIPYFISGAVGLALAALVLILGGVSGAHLNPAVTIGLWSLRRIKTLAAVAYIAAQLLGAVAAYYLFTYFINSQNVDAPWETTSTFEARILVAEAVGALIFTMGWAAAMYQKFTGLQQAVTIGASLTLGILVASVATVADGLFSGGFVNPAVALSSQSWVWGTYVLGPVLGGIIGFNLYALLFAPASELAAEAKSNSKKK